MDTAPPLADPTPNPLAIASVVLAFVGVIAYCCGSFMCLGWVGFLVWIAGAACGLIPVVQGAEGTSKTLAWVGLGTNLLFLVGSFALVFVGVGFGFLSEMAKQM